MKKHFTDNEEIKKIVLDGLKENDGYCPCIYMSRGKPEYKCPCENFKNDIKVGETCYCGLYIKDEM